MTSKNSLTQNNNQEKPLSLETQRESLNKNKEISMTLKTLIASVLLSSSLLIAGEAYARPNLTEEELAKARETAAQLKPPLDLDALFDEADRLGVICEGDLSRKIILKTCNLKVKNARLDEENARLDEEIKNIEADLTNRVNALAEKAEKLLSQ